MKENKQIIFHSIELMDEDHPTIAQFKLTLMLLVPKSHIATDIRTGFPNLMHEDREQIEEVIEAHFADYSASAEALRPLIYADQFLQQLEEPLALYFEQHSALQIMSANIEITADIMQNTQHLQNTNYKYKNGDA